MADTQLRSKTVAPLPIAGFDSINHNINTMDIQSAENSKFDTKEPMNIQGFCTVDFSSAIGVIGGLLIVYGLIA